MLTTDAEYRTLARAARSGNPNAIVAFHCRTGPVNRGTPYCDYTAGHPHPMAYSKGPWDNVNLRMVTAIENGPFIKGAFANDKDRPTANPDEGTLGHIFMPFQRNWKNGGANFPTDQALDWMTRVVNAGGFYTWAVARNGGLFAAPQFNQLLEMDAAMEQADVSPQQIEQIGVNSPSSSFSVLSMDSGLFIETDIAISSHAKRYRVSKGDRLPESNDGCLPHLPVARETRHQTTLSSERVASARVRIEPASVSRRHPRRRVEEQVANCFRSHRPGARNDG